MIATIDTAIGNALKPSTVRKAFAATGMVPFDPKKPLFYQHMRGARLPPFTASLVAGPAGEAAVAVAEAAEVAEGEVGAAAAAGTSALDAMDPATRKAKLEKLRAALSSVAELCGEDGAAELLNELPKESQALTASFLTQLQDSATAQPKEKLQASKILAAAEKARSDPTSKKHYSWGFVITSEKYREAAQKVANEVAAKEQAKVDKAAARQAKKEQLASEKADKAAQKAAQKAQKGAAKAKEMAEREAQKAQRALAKQQQQRGEKAARSYAARHATPASPSMSVTPPGAGIPHVIPDSMPASRSTAGSPPPAKRQRIARAPYTPQ